MVISDLISRLNAVGDDLPMMAKISSVSNCPFFIDIFGNRNNIAIMYLSDEKPLSSVKKCRTLVKELDIWVNESVNYQPESNVYLVSNYDYDDGSYDCRYYKVVDVTEENGQVVLIGNAQECESLREHFSAFDESMLDPD